ncbi:MAG: cytochrome c [Anaerolineae bacterium]|nr:MAG: cytochrome c [Anaerolineae bacterium]
MPGHPAMARPSTILLLGFSMLLAACAAQEPIVIQGTAVPPLPKLDSERVMKGERLYAQYCASCHGAELEGQPNWQQRQEDGSYPAPPQDSSSHTWHHPDELLLEIIANGGDPAFGLRMPGFEDQLSEDEMRAILEYIKSYWDTEQREFQWWISAR